MLTGLIGVLTILVPSITSAIPSIIEYFKSKANYTYQLQLLELQIKNSQVIAEGQLVVQELKAQEELVKSDAAMNVSPFWAWVRSSIRPTLTYLFTAMYLGVKIVFIITALQSGMSFIQVFPLVFTELDSQIYLAIISFWFSARLFDKYVPGSGIMKLPVVTKSNKETHK
jgi:hypothetical protein